MGQYSQLCFAASMSRRTSGIWCGGSSQPANTRANLSGFDRPMYSGIVLKLFPNWGRYRTNFITIQPKFAYILHDRDAQVLQI